MGGLVDLLAGKPLTEVGLEPAPQGNTGTPTKAVRAAFGTKPVLPQGHDDTIARIASEVKLDPELIRSVIQAESSGRPSAVSPRGAAGLMQLMPGTARGLSVTNRFDIEQNIRGGAMYLRQLMDQFGGDLTKALAAYNAGPQAVSVAIKSGADWMKRLPRETIGYVRDVLSRIGSAEAGDRPRQSDIDAKRITLGMAEEELGRLRQTSPDVGREEADAMTQARAEHESSSLLALLEGRSPIQLEPAPEPSVTPGSPEEDRFTPFPPLRRPEFRLSPAPEPGVTPGSPEEGRITPQPPLNLPAFRMTPAPEARPGFKTSPAREELEPPSDVGGTTVTVKPSGEIVIRTPPPAQAPAFPGRGEVVLPGGGVPPREPERAVTPPSALAPAAPTLPGQGGVVLPGGGAPPSEPERAILAPSEIQGEPPSDADLRALEERPAHFAPTAVAGEPSVTARPPVPAAVAPPLRLAQPSESIPTPRPTPVPRATLPPVPPFIRPAITEPARPGATARGIPPRITLPDVVKTQIDRLEGEVAGLRRTSEQIAEAVGVSVEPTPRPQPIPQPLPAPPRAETTGPQPVPQPLPPPPSPGTPEAAIAGEQRVELQREMDKEERRIILAYEDFSRNHPFLGSILRVMTGLADGAIAGMFGELPNVPLIGMRIPGKRLVPTFKGRRREEIGPPGFRSMPTTHEELVESGLILPEDAGTATRIAQTAGGLGSFGLVFGRLAKIIGLIPGVETNLVKHAVAFGTMGASKTAADGGDNKAILSSFSEHAATILALEGGGTVLFRALAPEAARIGAAARRLGRFTSVEEGFEARRAAGQAKGAQARAARTDQAMNVSRAPTGEGPEILVEPRLPTIAGGTQAEREAFAARTAEREGKPVADIAPDQADMRASLEETLDMLGRGPTTPQGGGAIPLESLTGGTTRAAVRAPLALSDAALKKMVQMQVPWDRPQHPADFLNRATPEVRERLGYPRSAIPDAELPTNAEVRAKVGLESGPTGPLRESVIGEKAGLPMTIGDVIGPTTAAEKAATREGMARGDAEIRRRLVGDPRTQEMVEVARFPSRAKADAFIREGNWPLESYRAGKEFRVRPISDAVEGQGPKPPEPHRPVGRPEKLDEFLHKIKSERGMITLPGFGKPAQRRVPTGVPEVDEVFKPEPPSGPSRLKQVISGLADAFWWERALGDQLLLKDNIRLTRGALRRVDSATRNDLEALTAGLPDPRQGGIFAELVQITNWQENLTRGVSNPGGLNAQQLAQARTTLEAAAKPQTQIAVGRHFQAMRNIWADLAARGLVDPKDARQFYAPQVVSQFIDPAGVVMVIPRRMREQRPGFLKERTGSEKDVVTDYLYTMRRYLTDVRRTIIIHDFLDANARRLDVTSRLSAAEKAKVLAGETITFQGKEYRMWQPDPGNQLFPSMTIPEADLQRGIAAGLTGQQMAQGTKVGKKTIKLREMLVMGGPKEPVHVIPKNVADRFDFFYHPRDLSFFVAANSVTNLWKAITIHSGLLSFQIMNLMGDMTNLYRTDAKAFRHLIPVMRDLREEARTGRASPFLELARRMDVQPSGFAGSDVPSLLKLSPELRRLQDIPPGREALFKIAELLERVRVATEIREAVPRLAVFREALRKAQIADADPSAAFWTMRGKEDFYRFYERKGFTEIRDLPRERAAAKIAREFTVDYGKMTDEENMILRGALFPFWAWTKQNTKNWALYSVKNPEQLAAKFLVPWAAMDVYNNTYYPEVERDLPMYRRIAPHIIPGWRDAEGLYTIFYFKGFPLTDALESAGLATGLVRLSDLANERLALSAFGRKHLNDMLGGETGPLNVATNLLSPFLKVPVELTTGQKAFSQQPIVPKHLEGTTRAAGLLASHALGVFFRPFRESETIARELRTGRWDPLISRVGLGLPIFRSADPRQKALAANRRTQDMLEEFRQRMIDRGMSDEQVRFFSRAIESGLPRLPIPAERDEGFWNGFMDGIGLTDENIDWLKHITGITPEPPAAVQPAAPTPTPEIVPGLGRSPGLLHRRTSRPRGEARP